ncbi:MULTISPECIES: hypothetical protein, partial [unclassified Bilifractor]|uniref:hypothetical protein n=1 Tax=unclassified Bilifractor TaxID=2815795 RepID=UPI003F8E6B8A
SKSFDFSIVLWISFWNRLCIQFSRYVSGFISHTSRKGIFQLVSPVKLFAFPTTGDSLLL